MRFPPVPREDSTARLQPRLENVSGGEPRPKQGCGVGGFSVFSVSSVLNAFESSALLAKAVKPFNTENTETQRKRGEIPLTRFDGAK